MVGNTYTIYSYGYPKDYANKDKRARTWSPYQYVPFYIKKEQVINIFVSGETKEKIFGVIGLPVDGTDMQTSQLVDGNNDIVAARDGLLSFTNYNENNNVFIEITSSHQRVPYFELYKNSNKEWAEEMEKYSDAPYVILSSHLSDIIVTYSSAKEYIKDAYKLIENNELIIKIQNRVSGLIDNGRSDYKLDSNRALHLEANKNYMFATNEYTGYNKANGAMPQLLGLSNDRFGVWHENGHQRQQYPWLWSVGSGMGEVTVNIYSLFAQEQIMGRATRFDDSCSEIKSFLAKTVKSYDNADLFVKLGLFWQLRLAFGDQFYPQLHQLYRLMGDTPSPDEHHEQKQLLIITVSHLVNINLGPFFDMWGIYSDINTLVQLSFLPALTKPIWENNNDNYHHLSMPETKYIPDLIYLKNSIHDVKLTPNNISFTIDKEWCLPYYYMFRINGRYIAEVKNGRPYYCSISLTNEGYRVSRTLDRDDDSPLTESDIFSVEVLGVHHGDEYIVYYSSVLINKLWEDLQGIYSDDSFTSLSSGTSQNALDSLWQRYNQSKNEYTIFIKNKILLAQQLLLHGTIKNDRRNEMFYSVEFSNTEFKDYTYFARSSGQVLGELRNGHPVFSDTISMTTWKIPADRYRYNEVDIVASVHGEEFLIRRVFWEDFVLRNKIEGLSDDNRFDEKGFNQKDIDNVRNSILNSDLPYWTKISLLNELDSVQVSYFENTIDTAYLSNQKVNVVFSNNAVFRNYRNMLMSDSGYISEVSYGIPYYSYLSGYTWTTNVTQEQMRSLYIIAFVNDNRYTIYKFSNETRNIILDCSYIRSEK